MVEAETTLTRRRERLQATFTLAAACLLMVLCCLAVYQWDNKYTRVVPSSGKGVMTLSEEDLADTVVPLIRGWEYYSGRLLTPDDFIGNTPIPDSTIFIGQYGGFDAGNPAASPHGSASYRLVLNLPEQSAQYELELPELFSAYRAYVNSELVASLGDPTPESYWPATQSRTIGFEATSQVEILIAVSDFSHIYSGMTYPPLFGSPEAVSELLSARLILRAVVDSIALVVGLFAILIGILSGRKALALRYGLLCLSFVGFTAYPLVKSLTDGFYPYYIVENFSFNAMLLIAVLLQGTILGSRPRLEYVFRCFGALALLASVLLPFALLSHESWVVVAYSSLVTVFEWATAALLTWRAGLALWQGQSHSIPLAVGVLMLDTTLVMDRLLIWHEPIITGWFYEIGCLALVSCIGIVVVRELAATYAANIVLKERLDWLKRLTALQEQNYQLMETRIIDAKAARHDLRHHLNAISALTKEGQLNKLQEYVGSINVPDLQPLEYSRNHVVNMLLSHFGLQAQNCGVSLESSVEIDAEIPIPDADFAAILSNLLENALEACARQQAPERHIEINIVQKPSLLIIRTENSADSPESAPGGGYFSSKVPRRKGYGLDSIRLIAARHGGDANFEYKAGVFCSTVMLFLGSSQYPT